MTIFGIRGIKMKMNESHELYEPYDPLTELTKNITDDMIRPLEASTGRLDAPRGKTGYAEDYNSAAQQAEKDKDHNWEQAMAHRKSGRTSKASLEKAKANFENAKSAYLTASKINDANWSKSKYFMELALFGEMPISAVERAEIESEAKIGAREYEAALLVTYLYELLKHDDGTLFSLWRKSNGQTNDFKSYIQAIMEKMEKCKTVLGIADTATSATANTSTSTRSTQSDRSTQPDRPASSTATGSTQPTRSTQPSRPASDNKK